MDISSWTIEERMQLPDWCFGERRSIAIAKTANGATTYAWQLDPTVLPDQICVWLVGYWFRQITGYGDFIRMGFRRTVPTSPAEMDECLPTAPEVADTPLKPNKIYLPETGTGILLLPVRKGVAIKGRKLAIEVYSASIRASAYCILTFSELPKNISGYLAESFFMKVR